MHALFFEVTPRPGHEGHYFERAAALRPVLEQNPGLMFIDRYKSLVRPNVILSHSLWKDEASLARWRTEPRHHLAQKAGREVHFEDYRLRIAQVIHAVTGAGEEQRWPGENPYNDPELAPRRLMLTVESTDEPFGRGEAFHSVSRDGVYIAVLHVANEGEGTEIIGDAATQDYVTGARLCLVSRDYGMTDRREAPQYFPPVKHMAGP